MPSPRSGMDIIAPSGKFCIAMPIASAMAAAAVIPESFIIAPANATPTDIPSGMLCSVTAKSIIVVFDIWAVLMPSWFLLSMCICGITVSRSRRKNIPARKPTSAASHSGELFPLHISIDGISKDHTEAAIITPAANPKSNFSNFGAIRFFKKNTIAEPSDVPRKGIANIMNSDIKAPFHVS